MNKKTSVLISSAGRRGALTKIFQQTLNDEKRGGEVFCADMSSLSAAFHLASASFVVPRCTHPSFVPRMLEICEKNAIGLIIPTIDTELSMYAAHRAEFEEIGTIVAVSQLETIEIGGDKEKTYEWLAANHFPTSSQTTPESVLDGTADSNTFLFPLIVKPKRGSSSIGVAKVGNIDELATAIRDGEFIVQTVSTGVEHTVDVYIDKTGNCRCAVPRRRLEVRAGEVSKAVTVKHEGMMKLAKQIAEKLPGAFGVLNIQMFCDENTNSIEIIEINPRFGGGFPLSWNAGANFPKWLIQEVRDETTDADWDSWRESLVMLRYDDAVFVNISEVDL